MFLVSAGGGDFVNLATEGPGAGDANAGSWCLQTFWELTKKKCLFLNLKFGKTISSRNHTHFF